MQGQSQETQTGTHEGTSRVAGLLVPPALLAL